MSIAPLRAAHQNDLRCQTRHRSVQFMTVSLAVAAEGVALSIVELLALPPAAVVNGTRRPG